MRHNHITPAGGSHGQLFRPYWGSLAWHSRWISVRTKPFSEARYCRGERGLIRTEARRLCHADVP